MTPVSWSRLQFAFTITYHYLFPQLTMGLALLLVILKARALREKRTPNDYDDAARFWARIFGINFLVGVVTGIPMEFQFGTNWARFSDYAGGVIGLTLALEGMFAFFAESAFLGLFLYREKELGPKKHFIVACILCAGSWSSGYFIIVTNAFMQHPVGHQLGAGGMLEIFDAWAYLTNPWAIWQYLHTMSAAVITGSFVMAAVGAYWQLLGQHENVAHVSLRTAIVVGMVACILQIFPTGDRSGKLVADHQPAALAAMEAKFDSSSHAEMVLIGQPDVDHHRIDNPVEVPWILSLLSYGSFGATVKGLDDFPRDEWPDNVELLYYAYHIMVGLGTILIAIMALGCIELWRKKLFVSRPVLWILMLAWPFPYIATTAGWMTAELGRQPWLVYGLMRTQAGVSPTLSSGTVAFSLIGWCGMYLVIGILFVVLVGREIAHGPQKQPNHEAAATT
ncbi:MAG: cytochrome ubiquinol oxidase subunit I [Polyangiaceae bacterium]